MGIVEGENCREGWIKDSCAGWTDKKECERSFNTEGIKGPSVLGGKRSFSVISIQPLEVREEEEVVEEEEDGIILKIFSTLGAFIFILLLANLGTSPTYKELN